MSTTGKISRRKALKIGAAAGALPLVHIRTAGAAGKLSIAFWDHWVPAGNGIMQKQVDAWAAANKVDVQADFITGNGNKLLMTGTAESQAKTGHDVYTFYNWDVHNVWESLLPVDDVMTRLIAKHGAPSGTAEYLAKKKVGWVAVPTSSGTQNKTPCVRISWFRKNGFDPQLVYPAKAGHVDAQDGWTWDSLLKFAELAAKDGLTFGLGMGGNTNTDATDTHGALFKAFGAALIDNEGTLQLQSPEVHAVLEFAQKLTKFYPPDAVSYDDASNNRALISGKSALIFNPPSAWAVAKRDSPAVAEDCWTIPSPSGPKGRYNPAATFFWGVWKFSSNQTAGKELIEHLMQREQVEERTTITEGYDLPPYAGLLDFKCWETVQPPVGTVYNYPSRPWHNAKPSLAASEAPPDIAVQIYNNAIHNQMMARISENQPIPQVLAWAKDQLEGFTR